MKNLNVWGDGGVICTNNDDLAKKLRLIRNHGLVGRDECVEFAYNSRLDTLQAIVASHLIKKIHRITDACIYNANFLDEAFSKIPQIRIPFRERENCKQVFHIYSVFAEKRDELISYLLEKDIDAKIHYPVPMHLQPAASKYGYQKGDFPISEEICNSTISLPVHEFVTQNQLLEMINAVRGFYNYG